MGISRAVVSTLQGSFAGDGRQVTAKAGTGKL
jgi:hypothetical protein